MKTIQLVASFAVTETALKVYAVIMSAIFLTLFVSTIVGLIIDPSVIWNSSFGYADGNQP